jgi:type IV pilus assembly protein PilV
MNMRVRKADGFTLIEVLVALLLLATGALGAGVMVLAAHRAGQQSSLTSAASQLAARVGESMRANPGASGAADGLNPYLQLDYDALADGAPADSGDCSAALCDSASLAAADLSAVRRTLYDAYPLGRIKICRDGQWWDPSALAMRWECDGAGGAPVVVKIGWRQRLAAGGAAAGEAPVLVALPLVLPMAAGAP